MIDPLSCILISFSVIALNALFIVLYIGRKL